MTEADKARARALYVELGSWAKVAAQMLMGVTTLRDKMGVTPQKRYSSRRPVDPSPSRVQVRRAGALYDPKRDGDPVYDNEVNAAVLGDPPRGRRELLEANAARTAPPEVHPNAVYWRL